MSLPTDRDARNAIPIWDGVIAYFPDVWAEIAKVSVLGNKQHGLGEKLHFDRTVSTDHLNKVFRHALDHSTGNLVDTDGTYHMAKAIWRACAELQVTLEKIAAQETQRGMVGQTGPQCGSGVAYGPAPGNPYPLLQNDTIVYQNGALADRTQVAADAPKVINSFCAYSNVKAPVRLCSCDPCCRARNEKATGV